MKRERERESKARAALFFLLCVLSVERVTHTQSPHFETVRTDLSSFGASMKSSDDRTGVASILLALRQPSADDIPQSSSSSSSSSSSFIATDADYLAKASHLPGPKKRSKKLPSPLSVASTIDDDPSLLLWGSHAPQPADASSHKKCPRKKRARETNKENADELMQLSLTIPNYTTVSLNLSRDSVRDLLDDTAPPRWQQQQHHQPRLALLSFPGEKLSSTALRQPVAAKMPCVGKTEKARFRPASSQVSSPVRRPPHAASSPRLSASPLPVKRPYTAVSRPCAAAA